MFKIFAENRQARYNYHIIETFEAGMVLTGPEVKSVRNGKSELKDGYAHIEGREVFMENVHISPYEKARCVDYNPQRKRKLLLHRSQINKLTGRVQEKGLTLIPLRIYLNNGVLKVALGLAKGKRRGDKREDIKKRDAEREIRRAIKSPHT